MLLAKYLSHVQNIYAPAMFSPSINQGDKLKGRLMNALMLGEEHDEAFRDCC
jgi:hypothetical protein